MAANDTAGLEPGVDKDELAERAARDPKALAEVMEALSGADRRKRQQAALVRRIREGRFIGVRSILR